MSATDRWLRSNTRQFLDLDNNNQFSIATRADPSFHTVLSSSPLFNEDSFSSSYTDPTNQPQASSSFMELPNNNNPKAKRGCKTTTASSTTGACPNKITTVTTKTVTKRIVKIARPTKRGAGKKAAAADGNTKPSTIITRTSAADGPKARPSNTRKIAAKNITTETNAGGVQPEITVTSAKNANSKKVRSTRAANSAQVAEPVNAPAAAKKYIVEVDLGNFEAILDKFYGANVSSSSSSSSPNFELSFPEVVEEYRPSSENPSRCALPSVDCPICMESLFGRWSPFEFN